MTFQNAPGQKNRPGIDPERIHRLRALSEVVEGFGGADGDRTRDLVNAIHLVSASRHPWPAEALLDVLEVVFGEADQRLTIRYDAGTGRDHT